MKFGIRVPSLSKRISARISPSRFFRHSLGFKAPRGFGWFTNPKRALYNRVYNRTTIKADNLIILGVLLVGGLLFAIIGAVINLFRNASPNSENSDLLCPRCSTKMVLRNGKKGKFYGCTTFPRCRGTRNFIE